MFTGIITIYPPEKLNTVFWLAVSIIPPITGHFWCISIKKVESSATSNFKTNIDILSGRLLLAVHPGWQGKYGNPLARLVVM